MSIGGSLHHHVLAEDEVVHGLHALVTAVGELLLLLFSTGGQVS